MGNAAELAQQPRRATPARTEPHCLGLFVSTACGSEAQRQGAEGRQGQRLQSPTIQPLATSHLNANAMAAALQGRLENASAEFQKLQNDLTLAVDARQKLEAQLSENELVKKVPISSFVSLALVQRSCVQMFW